MSLCLRSSIQRLSWNWRHKLTRCTAKTQTMVVYISEGALYCTQGNWSAAFFQRTTAEILFFAIQYGITVRTVLYPSLTNVSPLSETTHISFGWGKYTCPSVQYNCKNLPFTLQYTFLLDVCCSRTVQWHRMGPLVQVQCVAIDVFMYSNSGIQNTVFARSLHTAWSDLNRFVGVMQLFSCKRVRGDNCSAWKFKGVLRSKYRTVDGRLCGRFGKD